MTNWVFFWRFLQKNLACLHRREQNFWSHLKQNLLFFNLFISDNDVLGLMLVIFAVFFAQASSCLKWPGLWTSTQQQEHWLSDVFLLSLKYFCFVSKSDFGTSFDNSQFFPFLIKFSFNVKLCLILFCQPRVSNL